MIIGASKHGSYASPIGGTSNPLGRRRHPERRTDLPSLLYWPSL